MPFGSGDFTYEVVEGWGDLPSGYELFQVAGVAVDADDRVYAFNRSAHKLIVFDRDGGFIKAWKDTFEIPHGMRIGPDGSVFLVDQGSHVVLKYSPDEELLMTLGNRGQPSNTGYTNDHKVVERAAGPFNNPTGVAISASGDIFVSDGYGNCRVHKYSPDGELLKTWGVPGTDAPGEFHLPHGIGIDNQGRLLVADRENHRIQLFTQDGDHVETWTGFRQPCSVTVGPDGDRVRARAGEPDEHPRLGRQRARSVGWRGEQGGRPLHCASRRGRRFQGETSTSARCWRAAASRSSPGCDPSPFAAADG